MPWSISTSATAETGERPDGPAGCRVPAWVSAPVRRHRLVARKGFILTRHHRSGAGCSFVMGLLDVSAQGAYLLGRRAGGSLSCAERSRPWAGFCRRLAGHSWEWAPRAHTRAAVRSSGGGSAGDNRWGVNDLRHRGRRRHRRQCWNDVVFAGGNDIVCGEGGTHTLDGTAMTFSSATNWTAPSSHRRTARTTTRCWAVLGNDTPRARWR